MFLTDGLFPPTCMHAHTRTHTHIQGQIERALDGVAKDVGKVVDEASHSSPVVSGLSL